MAPLAAGDLLARYLEGPALVRDAVAGLEPAALSRADEGEWSVHDILVHLADAEIVRAVRFRLILGEGAPVLSSFDQDNWQARLAYPARSAELALATFETMVRSSHELLAALPPESLERHAPHPDGPLSCLDLLQRGINHAAQHAAQVAQTRAVQQ